MKPPQIDTTVKQPRPRTKSPYSGLTLRTKEERGITFITARRVKYFPDAWLYSLDWYTQADSLSEEGATQERIVFAYLRHAVTVTGNGLTKLLPLVTTHQVGAISKTKEPCAEFAIGNIEIEKRDEDDD